ncbi:isoamylase early set domain-containing protein [Treponema pectinovorum]|uniref:isoamylase early set domain-containing protein n=1 Tax=Treponema pectinovorum TaxID=164 RepID=UPI0011C6EFB6|nr:isoamylase early set domain-containing protein [Treponema pectinovorum]
MAVKKDYSPDAKTCKVTFIVKKEALQGAQGVTIAGDFNSWSSTETPLKKEKNGSFSVTLELEAGKEYQYRYLLDGSRWENDWDADKYIPAPFSNTENSVVVCIPSEKDLKKTEKPRAASKKVTTKKPVKK